MQYCSRDTTCNMTIKTILSFECYYHLSRSGNLGLSLFGQGQGLCVDQDTLLYSTVNTLMTASQTVNNGY